MIDQPDASIGTNSEESLDERILAFETAAAMYKGEYWAPESALPCAKLELFELLRVRRSTTRRVEPIYQRLTNLMVDLTLFVPDADLKAAQPFLSPGGGITGRLLTDPTESRDRDRAYETFRGHKTERERLLETASIDASRRPIGKAFWRRRGNYPHLYHDATDPEADDALRLAREQAGETPKPAPPFDDGGADQAVLFMGWLPPLLTAAVCAPVLWVIGDPQAALVTLVGGPLVGYVACLTLWFVVGNLLKSIGPSARVQELFMIVTILIGIPVAIALAAAASVDPMLGLQAVGVAIGWVVLCVVLLIVYDWLTD
jgi:hypothetical protein